MQKSITTATKNAYYRIMQIFILLIVMICLHPKLLSATPPASLPQSTNDQWYALGWDLGKIVKGNHPFLNFDKVSTGLKDSLQGSPGQLSQERIDALGKELAKESNLGPEEQSKRRIQQKSTSQGTSSNDDLGYALGWKLGQIVEVRHPGLEHEGILSGLTDSMHGRPPKISQERINILNKKLAEQNKVSPEEQKSAYEQKRAAQAEKNLKEGSAFLVKNKLEKGVSTTATGLQYTVLQQGAGPIPKKDDYVNINYRGLLIDGTEFDSSYKRGRAYEGFVDKALPGWTEILQLMRVGSKYRIYLPPELAYGDEGYGPIIEPNTTLIYELELLSIQNNPPKNAARPINVVLSQIDLSNMEKSAGSFLKLYNGISPNSTKDDLSTICQILSAKSSIQACTDVFTERLTHIQGIKNIKKAIFSDKKIAPQDMEQRVVLVSWQEQLTLADAKTITTMESLLIQFIKEDSLWKIEKISKPVPDSTH